MTPKGRMNNTKSETKSSRSNNSPSNKHIGNGINEPIDLDSDIDDTTSTSREANSNKNNKDGKGKTKSTPKRYTTKTSHDNDAYMAQLVDEGQRLAQSNGHHGIDARDSNNDSNNNNNNDGEMLRRMSSGHDDRLVEDVNALIDMFPMADAVLLHDALQRFDASPQRLQHAIEHLLANPPLPPASSPPPRRDRPATSTNQRIDLLSPSSSSSSKARPSTPSLSLSSDVVDPVTEDARELASIFPDADPNWYCIAMICCVCLNDNFEMIDEWLAHCDMIGSMIV
jgi:hypothetical protein